MKKIFSTISLSLFLISCSTEEPVSTVFAELCSEKSGIVEVADDVYCNIDYNGDGFVDSSEYCSYTDFTSGLCDLDGYTETVSCLISEGEAENLANAAVEDYDWGVVESIEFNVQHKTYGIYYPTSQEEISLFGERGLDVDCNTGQITFWPQE